MSKASTATARDTPVKGATAGHGGLVVRADTIVVGTTDRVQLEDLTGRINELVRASGVKEGMVSVWSLHTTCAVFINETQAALHADIKAFLEQVIARDGKWRHNDPAHSDCDRMNADSHLRAMLLGHSLALQVSDGEVVLGQWQRALMAELDGPRERTIRVQIMGIS